MNGFTVGHHRKMKNANDFPSRLEVICTNSDFVLDSKQASASLLAADNVQRLRDEVKAAEEILPRLVDRAAALYLLAHHYAR